MDLVEDYLHAVALLLPKAQRDDIVAELRDTILSRIEAREKALGRPLTADETEAVLREVGHPLLVAARYREGPQQLLGPALYPYWAFAVKVALTIVAVTGVLSLVVRLLATGDLAYALGGALMTSLSGAASLVGIVTIVAWIIERQGGSISYLDRWRVRDLKGLEFLAWDFDTIRDHLWAGGGPSSAARASQGPRRASMRRAGGCRRSRSTVDRAIGAIVVGVVVIVWWVGLLPFSLVSNPAQMRGLGLDPGAFTAARWGQVQGALFWPVLAFGLALCLQGVLLWRWPRAIRVHGLINLGIAALVLACVAWVWLASPLAPSLHVDSLAGLALQVKEALRQPPPKPVGPFIAVLLCCIALGALARALHGLLQLVLGPPPADPALAQKAV